MIGEKQMKKIILNIEGMSCSACSNGLEKHLNKQPGIHSASVNLVLAQALIEYEDSLTIEDLDRFVAEAGFKSLGEVGTNHKKEKKQKNKLYLWIVIVIAIITVYISMAHLLALPEIPFLTMKTHPINYALTLCLLSSIVLLYGLDIIKSGIKNLFHKTPNMDTLVTLGVLSSLLYSLFSLSMVIKGNTHYLESLYFESIAVIIIFIKLGRYLDTKNKEKTKEAIEKLVQITPTTALLKVQDSTKEVTIDEIKKGDILIAKPGMKIAVDGHITSGSTHLEEAFITGESVPVKKKVQDKVIAGSINYDGYIEYKAEKIGKDSTISEIVRLVVEATNTKAPISKLADKVSSYFVPIIILIAILTFIGYLILGFELGEATTAFVSVLVVACPCALGLATPLAIVVSEGTCAQNGILVRTSEILENAHKVDTVIFDKTGTLTYGDLKLAEFLNFTKKADHEVLAEIAAAESQSSHPIAKAFVTEETPLNNSQYKVTEFKNLPGIGMQAMINEQAIYIGNNKLFSKLKLNNPYKKKEEKLAKEENSIVYVIKDNKIIALIGIKDMIRKDAKKTVESLKQQGKEIIMLTGDNELTAHNIAASIGIEKVIANVLPTEKTAYIKELKKSGRQVMMVGDGINDAPSLATANVGVSMSGATDIAVNSADVILTTNHLEKIPLLISISKNTIRNIKQNLFWAFFYNICMIPLAIGIARPLGLIMNPMIAALAMTLSSLTVILNALRLKKVHK